jgi:subtilisin family serine protease
MHLTTPSCAFVSFKSLLMFSLCCFCFISSQSVAVVIQIQNDGGMGGGGMGGVSYLRTPPVAPLHAPGKLLVKFEAGLSDTEKQSILTGTGVLSSEPLLYASELPGSVLHNWLVATVLATDQATIKATLENHAAVEVVEYDHSIVAQATPNDSQFGVLWNLHDPVYDSDIDAPEAWDMQTESDVLIAVLDSGVDYNHPELNQSIWRNFSEIPGNNIDDDANGYVDDFIGFNFTNNTSNAMDDLGHGSHVAGIIGATGNNNYGVAGVNWRANIMPLKILNSVGVGYTSNAIKAMAYAVSNGAKVVNASWGTDQYNQAMADAIATLNNNGVLFVTAAGNFSRDIDTTPYYPASYEHENIIAVSASGRSDISTWFDNRGTNSVDLAAPGYFIFSTVPVYVAPIPNPGGSTMPGFCALCTPTGFNYASGTSMAAAHVTGAAALIWAIDPKLTVAEMKYQILNNVDPASWFVDYTVSGGRLNVFNAIPTEPGPDLVVTKMELTDLQFYTGESFQLNVTFKNRGELRPAVRETTVKVYLSKDRIITEDDSYVGNYRIFSSLLGPGQESTRTIRGKISARLEGIPADDRFHTYYIGAIIDPGPYDSVDETHENNNTFLHRDFVRVKKDVDLTMQSATSSVTTIPIGQTFKVSGTIANIGNSWLTSNWTWTYIGAYLSVDATWSDDDVRVGIDKVRHFYIEPGESYNATLTAWPFPRDINPGTYYLILRADELDWEDETDETNNTIAGPKVTLTSP